MFTPKQIMAESARRETSKRSDLDGSQLSARPFPVYIVEYNAKKNSVIVKRRGDASFSKKEYLLFHHPKEMGHLSPSPGDKVYFYPRGIGDSGSVVMYGHDAEEEASIRKANPSLYT